MTNCQCCTSAVPLSRVPPPRLRQAGGRSSSADSVMLQADGLTAPAVAALHKHGVTS